MKSFFITPLLATIFAWATSSEGLIAQCRMMDSSKCERPGTLGKTGRNPSIIRCVHVPYFCSSERVAAVCVPWKSASLAVNARFAEERLILVDSDADVRGRDSTRDPIPWIVKSGKSEHEGKSLDSDYYWTRCPRFPDNNCAAPETVKCLRGIMQPHQRQQCGGRCLRVPEELHRLQ